MTRGRTKRRGLSGRDAPGPPPTATLVAPPRRSQHALAPGANSAPAEPSATAGTTEASEGHTEGIALAAAVAAKPKTKTLTDADRGRPRTPVFPGALFVGAALVAIPVLLMGSANDDGPRRRTGRRERRHDSGPRIGLGGSGGLHGGVPHRPRPSNLVVHKAQNKPIWAAMTFGQNRRAIFQPGGNLAVHNGDDRAIWASKTHEFGGARTVLRPDAKVVIVHNGRVVWPT